DDEEVMLIGGANLYQQSFELVTDLYITRIHHEFDGDTWFPDFDESQWKIENRETFEADHCNPHAYSFTKFVREI
ncbi:MAG: dihydrofolate reductase, partial [Gammaproteobacteria bacterium]|nr:dihydrofolate reductase [Gammaproteobacteria bacterium]